VSYIEVRIRRRAWCTGARGREELPARSDATALYRRFNKFEPTAMMRLTCPRRVPGVLVRLGELRGLIYRSDKWQRGRPRTYIHFMEDPPILASDANGRQLFLLGGSYRVTDRGIEG